MTNFRYDDPSRTVMIDAGSDPGAWQEAIKNMPGWRGEMQTRLEKGATQVHIESVLEERGKRYGDFIDHAAISQHLKQSMACPGWHELSCDQKEALEMIVHKIARILNGDPNYADSWVDIAGYAKLVADRLERPSA